MARDLATALVCLAASLLFFALTLDLPGPSLLVPIGPGYYPRIILGITAALSAVLLAQTLLARRRAQNPASRTKPNYGLVAWSFAVFGAYVAVLPLLGFRIATMGFMLGAQWLLGRPRTMRAWLAACVIAVVGSFATFHLFQDYLSVLLPRGRWTDF